MSVHARRAGGLRPAGALAVALTTAFLATSAGCSASGAPDEGEEAADEVLTVEQARGTYLDLADGFNAALDPFYDEYSRASPSLPALQEAAGDASRAAEAFADGMSAVAWPEEVDPAAVSAVVEDYEVYATQWQDVAAADSVNEVQAVLCEMDADGDTSANVLNRLHADLDVKPVEFSASPDCAGNGRDHGGDRVTP